MKVLLVIAHPLEKSLCRALASCAEQALLADGHEVFVEDLYSSGFSPVLSVAERAAYYGASGFEPDRGRTGSLLDAEAIVLVFPTWWFGFPAILKGWFDRIFLPGVAYHHAHDLGSIKPNLDRLKKVLAITTLGAPWWIDWLAMFRPVRRILRHAIFGTCAQKVQFRYLALYRAENVSPERFESFARRIRRAVKTWRMG